eukprot:SAG31_NODE_5899_length_2265_cov_1.992151_1_plen_196_part_00
MLRALYLHKVDELANKLTLGHLTKYNMAWGGIPVAPEGRNTEFELFGDQYSNFNAGKLLLLLEGIGGLHYSLEDDVLTFADSLPTNWTFFEIRLPIKPRSAANSSWVTCRAERQCQPNGMVSKTVTIDGNPLSTLELEPWVEDASKVVGMSPNGGILNKTTGHAHWTLGNAAAGRVKATLTLKVKSCESNADIPL